VILDTAGRLHIDEEMMQELVDIMAAIEPSETLLVVDAMTGQDAVNVALTFLDKIDFNGLIITKMDGDARGGAALSMKAVTGKPIKLASVGEKMNDLEVFYPERVASRILGMGDVVTLVEKAEESMTEEKARKLEEKLRKQKFDFDDFLDQMQQLKEMGGLTKVLEMVPGMGGMARQQGMEVSDNQLQKIEAIIHSMTRDERKNPHVLNASRRRRIASGSGTTTQDVNQLVKQFAQMQKMLKAFTGKGGASMGMLKRLFPF
jgi:signal recognition particle subunit SRP54